ncbi:MAG: hypothetical protein E6R03_11660 [Hyphomicrobiaceae bacterium]|nr:MAG: hypothetical protein E6R03_11660 [Hyphomicrobiaceae bacterium]
MESGKTYHITHFRKGSFDARCIGVDDDAEFVDLEILDGKATHLTQPTAEKGDVLRCRMSLLTFTELDPATMKPVHHV